GSLWKNNEIPPFFHFFRNLANHFQRGLYVLSVNDNSFYSLDYLLYQNPVGCFFLNYNSKGTRTCFKKSKGVKKPLMIRKQNKTILLRKIFSSSAFYGYAAGMIDFPYHPA